MELTKYKPRSTDELTIIEPQQTAFLQGAVSCRCFMVFNSMGEDWEQMSIAFKTFEEAKAYYDRQDRKKYPYLRILAELSYNGT